MPSNQPNIPYVLSIYTATRCLKFEVEKSTKLVSKKTAHLFKAGMGGGRLGSGWSVSAFHSLSLYCSTQARAIDLLYSFFLLSFPRKFYNKIRVQSKVDKARWRVCICFHYMFRRDSVDIACSIQARASICSIPFFFLLLSFIPPENSTIKRGCRARWIRLGSRWTASAFHHKCASK
jgi:hypothetical protein